MTLRIFRKALAAFGGGHPAVYVPHIPTPPIGADSAWADQMEAETVAHHDAVALGDGWSFPDAHPGSHQGYVTGRWYPTFRGTLDSATAIASSGRLWMLPFFQPRRITIDRIGFRVHTGGAGASVKFGIWRAAPPGSFLADGSTPVTVGMPYGSPVVVDNTGKSVATSDSSAEAAVSATLVAGHYWWGQIYSATAAVMRGIPNTTTVTEADVGRTNLAGTTSIMGLYKDQSYATTLGTMAGDEVWTNATVGGLAIMHLRAA